MPIWLTALIAILVIIFLWILFYKLYMRNAANYYRQNVLNLDEIKVDSTAMERLLKLYFNRQQTYEFSGYAILGVTILFLGAAIIVFIFSNEIVIASGTKQDTRDFWISLISLRAGISLIVFFICQILLKLYRYCVKFAVFYIGLFDSLMIHKEIGKDLKETIEMFMPSTDIGENPQSPANEILQTLANLEKSRSTVGKL